MAPLAAVDRRSHLLRIRRRQETAVASPVASEDPFDFEDAEEEMTSEGPVESLSVKTEAAWEGATQQRFLRAAGAPAGQVAAEIQDPAPVSLQPVPVSQTSTGTTESSSTISTTTPASSISTTAAPSSLSTAPLSQTLSASQTTTIVPSPTSSTGVIPSPPQLTPQATVASTPQQQPLPNAAVEPAVVNAPAVNDASQPLITAITPNSDIIGVNPAPAILDDIDLSPDLNPATAAVPILSALSTPNPRTPIPAGSSSLAAIPTSPAATSPADSGHHAPETVAVPFEVPDQSKPANTPSTFDTSSSPATSSAPPRALVAVLAASLSLLAVLIALAWYLHRRHKRALARIHGTAPLHPGKATEKRQLLSSTTTSNAPTKWFPAGLLPASSPTQSDNPKKLPSLKILASDSAEERQPLSAAATASPATPPTATSSALPVLPSPSSAGPVEPTPAIVIPSLPRPAPSPPQPPQPQPQSAAPAPGVAPRLLGQLRGIVATNAPGGGTPANQRWTPTWNASNPRPVGGAALSRTDSNASSVASSSVAASTIGRPAARRAAAATPQPAPLVRLDTVSSTSSEAQRSANAPLLPAMDTGGGFLLPEVRTGGAALFRSDSGASSEGVSTFLRMVRGTGAGTKNAENEEGSKLRVQDERLLRVR
ncbi:hypothetical protein HDU96_010440 [Phlyctochytrium bullatum]|nr:hypothetical protein HDU96_010440 [Phlyctochytrium bullatum]